MRTVACLAALLVIAARSLGGDWEGCLSNWGVSCPGMRIPICPAGDFKSIRDCCGYGSGYIWGEIIDFAYFAEHYGHAGAE